MKADKATITLYTSELVYTKGALEKTLKDTEDYLEITKRDFPGCEDVVEIAINNYKSTIATINKALEEN